ncbi:MAG: hypothetical protein ACXITV_06655 [Luteibaculaceae bacterium]
MQFKNPLTLPLLLAFVAMAVKYFFGVFSPQATQEHPVILAHILFILTSVYFAISGNKENPGFLTDTKLGLKAAGVYIVVYVLFLWVFYTQIKPTHFSVRVAQQINLILRPDGFKDFEIEKTYFALKEGQSVEQVNSRLQTNAERDSLALDKYQELFPAAPIKASEEQFAFTVLIRDMDNKLSGFFNLRNYIALTLMSFLLIAIIYSAIISLIVRRFLNKFGNRS